MNSLINYFLLSLFCIPLAIQAQKITVTDAAGLIRSIKSDVTIKLKPGVYNLTDADGTTGSENIRWVEEYDGDEFQIHNVKNLTLIGSKGTEIVVSPRYIWVIKFVSCSNIIIKDIKLGHTVGGYCTGGVLSFENCKDITISSCDMYGSGTEGLQLQEVDNFTMTNSTIHDCTYDLMSVYNCKQVTFNNCLFTKTGEFNLVTIDITNDISFLSCTFSENFNDTYYPYLFSIGDHSGKVKLEKCKFIDNKVTSFCDNYAKLILSNCKFSGNKFGEGVE